MKLFCVVLAALICCSALAADDVDCKTFVTQATCPADNCNFTSADTDKKTCTSSCLGLAADKCNEQAKYCSFNATKCTAVFTTCDQASGKDQAACTALNGNCQFAAGTDASCTATDATTKICTDLVADQGKCTANANCQYNQTFDACISDAKLCTVANCDKNQCTSTAATCTPNVDCTALSQDDCGKNAACKVNGDACENVVACDVNNCDKDNCKSTDATCVVNNAFCAKNADAQTCTTATCVPTYKDQSCTVKDTVCDVTKCDANLCTEVKAVASKCSNVTCKSQDFTKCDTGCQGADMVCQAIAGSAQCDKDAPTTKDACSKVGFCSFVQFGTCAAKDSGTNAIILAFSGLIALFAMI